MTPMTTCNVRPCVDPALRRAVVLYGCERVPRDLCIAACSLGTLAAGAYHETTSATGAWSFAAPQLAANVSCGQPRAAQTGSRHT